MATQNMAPEKRQRWNTRRQLNYGFINAHSSGAGSALAHVERKVNREPADKDFGHFFFPRLWSVSLERRCKRGGGYRMRAKSYPA
jgi:hypothetical protein